jgi:hypothetical protein
MTSRASHLPTTVLLSLLIAGGLVGCNKKDKPAADSGGTPAPTGGPAPAPGPTPPGPTPPGPNPPQPNPPTPTAPKFNFDVSKLGYDPTKPELTIAARQWPRRSAPRDMSLLGYNGKIIATEGRIYTLNGTDRGPNNAPLGKVRAHLNLFDASGQLFGDDGKAMAVSTYLADVIDWKQFRPGQVVKVVGRAQTPKDAPTSLGLHDAIALPVSAEGDAPMTPEQYDDALRKDPKTYAGGFTTDKYVTFTATVTDAATPNDPQGPVIFFANGKSKIRCTITNWDDHAANPPKAGETVTLIGKAEGYTPATNKWQFRALYLGKK